jgi:Ran GTPase-activating protein (RanGAP) involved in mRNA processing and transport
MSKLEKALEIIANGAEEVYISSAPLDLESVHRLMAACSAESSRVKNCDISYCALDSQAVEVISLSVRSNSVLTCLDLGYNRDIGPQSAQVLGEMLCRNGALKFLYLYQINAGDAGAGHLAVALRQNRTLEELQLGNNGITSVGAAGIAASLPLNQMLMGLFLDNNPLGDDGVKALAKAVPRSGLRELWLHNTRIGERGCAALVEMLKNGSRLQELRADSDHWPALDEGFRCNGWLLEGALTNTLSATRPCTCKPGSRCTCSF